MTFNIRFDNPRDAAEGHAWRDRFDSVIATIRDHDPDVVGFQEALRAQLDDLTSALPGYRAIGKPREIGETAEYVPLFFRRSRFELHEHGDFWLSATPEAEGSRGWDADVPRHCTWARLTDRDGAVPFAVFNTHLDRWGVVARAEAAKVIVARAALAPDLPSVIMGDLNAEEDSDPLMAFRAAGFGDTFREVHPETLDVQTVHHYRDLSGNRKIDYILCNAMWTVVAADIVRAPAAGRLPSDHFPVVAELASMSRPSPAPG